MLNRMLLRLNVMLRRQAGNEYKAKTTRGKAGWGNKEAWNPSLEAMPQAKTVGPGQALSQDHPGIFQEGKAEATYRG